MAHKKGMGSSRNGRDSAGQRLGMKAAAGQVVPDDPDRLTTVYNSCIQGLALGVQFLGALYSSFPTADTVLRMLRPC